LKNHFTHLTGSEKEGLIFSIINTSQYSLDIIKDSSRKIEESLPLFHILTGNIVMRNSDLISQLKEHTMLVYEVITILNNLVKEKGEYIYQKCLSKFVCGIMHILNTRCLDNDLVDELKDTLKIFHSFGPNFSKTILDMCPYKLLQKHFVENPDTLEPIADFLVENKWIMENFDLLDDKYLDPLMFTLIETPVFLPDTNTVVELSHIIRHFESSNTNPFTKQPLTLKNVLIYNDTPDIIERQKTFLDELNAHIKSLKQEKKISL
tara:strand:- start:5502 stop:6293 length:792 start_codon:yes stop_codon:yes gene_type:complete